MKNFTDIIGKTLVLANVHDNNEIVLGFTDGTKISMQSKGQKATIASITGDFQNISGKVILSATESPVEDHMDRFEIATETEIVVIIWDCPEGRDIEVNPIIPQVFKRPGNE